MAIVLKSKVYNEIKIHSKTIIGVVGNNYKKFLLSLQGDAVYYLDSKLPKNDKYSVDDKLLK